MTTFSEFLENVPPHKETEVSDLFASSVTGGTVLVKSPEIELDCDNSKCNGKRTFRSINDQSKQMAKGVKIFSLTYQCSNCRISEKIFSVLVVSAFDQQSNLVVKLGEMPSHISKMPSRLISMIRPDRELFLKGMWCESRGLGIGAFIYYRRVVGELPAAQ